MHNLPPELSTVIIRDFLDDVKAREKTFRSEHGYVPSCDGYAGYASLSSTWQDLIEPITFRRLYLDLPRMKQATENGILTPRRLSYVQRVEVLFRFPAHDATLESGVSGRSEPNTEDNNAVYTKTIVSAFHLLAAMPVTETPSTRLIFKVPVPMNVWAHMPDANRFDRRGIEDE